MIDVGGTATGYGRLMRALEREVEATPRREEVQGNEEKVPPKTRRKKIGSKTTRDRKHFCCAYTDKNQAWNGPGTTGRGTACRYR